MEAAERDEEEAGAKITVKKKKAGKGKSSFRQTKLAAGGEKNSLEVTKPSPFAEGIDPVIPEFNANPKKTGGGGRKRPVKAESTDAADTSLKEESNQGEGEGKVGDGETKKAKVESSEDVLVAVEGKKVVKPTATTTSGATGAAAGRKKTKAKCVVMLDDDDEIEINDDSDDMDVRTLKF